MFVLSILLYRIYIFILYHSVDVKPDHQGTSLTKGKDRKKRDKSNRNSLRPDSPGNGGSDASDNDKNGEADDVRIPDKI